VADQQADRPEIQVKEGRPAMTVSIPLFAIVGVLVYVAWRYMGLRMWQLLACVALGVLLAATSAGPEIVSFLNGLARWLSTSSGGAR
jgi:hypothetical protein